MNLITVLVLLSLMPLLQAANPACLLYLTRHCPRLLTECHLPTPPYPLLLMFYISIRICATVFDILKTILGDLSLALMVANITIGPLIDILETCHDLTLMLVMGSAMSYLASSLAQMITVSNQNKSEMRLRGLALDTLEVECPSKYYIDLQGTLYNLGNQSKTDSKL